MKSIIKLALVVALAAVAPACGSKTTASNNAKATALQKAFDTAEPALKGLMTRAVAEINKADYLAAVADLGALNRVDTLTAEQKQAVTETLGQVVPLLPPPKTPLAPMAPSR